MQYQVFNNWLGKQDSNQSMHFTCIAFSLRKTRAKLRRARSGEFAARNSMLGGRRAGCYSNQVYRGRASGFQGAEPTRLPPHSTHWCRHGLAEPEPPIKGLAPRFAGLWVVRASIPTPRTNGAQTHVVPFPREVPEPQERRPQEGERKIERDSSAQTLGRLALNFHRR